MLVVWEKVACAVLLNSWYSSGSPSSSQPPLIASTRAFRFASSPSHFWLIMCLFAYVYRSGPRRKSRHTQKPGVDGSRAAVSSGPIRCLSFDFSCFIFLLLCRLLIFFSRSLVDDRGTHRRASACTHTHTEGKTKRRETTLHRRLLRLVQRTVTLLVSRSSFSKCYLYTLFLITLRVSGETATAVSLLFRSCDTSEAKGAMSESRYTRRYCCCISRGLKFEKANWQASTNRQQCRAVTTAAAAAPVSTAQQ